MSDELDPSKISGLVYWIDASYESGIRMEKQIVKEIKDRVKKRRFSIKKFIFNLLKKINVFS